MPTWSRPADIVYDHAAAAMAVEAVAAMRFTLELTWDAEDASASDALATWEGLAADAFRVSHGSRQNTTEDIVRQLRLLQSGIEGAIADAHAAQARVDALQAEWDEQRQAELLAAAEAERADASAPAAETAPPPSVPLSVR